MTLKIAIIGSRGIPAKYGGFETFADEISKRLVAKGYEIYVSCEGGITPKIREYCGVYLFYFPLKPFCRVVYETIYDIYCLIKSSLACDYIYMLGYGAGFSFFIPILFRKKLFVNVDGIEWRRDKYSKIEKLILYLNEIFAVHLADVIIADSTEIKKYIESKHGKSAVYISYGVEQPHIELWDSSKLKQISSVNNFTNLESNSYYLVVARLEPENNIHVIVEGFLLSNTTKKLIIVGNFLSEKYKLSIDRIITKLSGHDRIVFTKGIYKKDLLNMLRQNCFAYLHGHSAGGTNPSLLEAMVMKNIIIAHDNEFNREVGSNTILTFRDAVGLKTCIESIENNPSIYIPLKYDAYKRVLTYYSWENIAMEYNNLFRSTFSNSITETHKHVNDSHESQISRQTRIWK
jgi:Glycosyltransferase